MIKKKREIKLCLRSKKIVLASEYSYTCVNYLLSFSFSYSHFLVQIYHMETAVEGTLELGLEVVLEANILFNPVVHIF